MEEVHSQLQRILFTIGGTLLIAGVLGTLYLGAYNTNHGRQRPPGPRGLPILGNVLQIPGEHLATYFRLLVEKYGGLVSLNLAGTPVILIGEMNLAKDILEKRAAKFSSRPVVPYLRHVDPTQSYWGIHGQIEAHHIGRRLTAGLMSSVRAGLTEPLQHFEALLTIQHLLADGGKNWFRHVNRLAASTALTAAFGVHCSTGNEPELDEAMFSVNEFVKLCTPSATVINVLPFLDWIPGPMPWRTRARAYRKREDAFYKKLIHEAVSGKASGMNTWAAAFAKEDKPEGNQSRLMNQFTGAAIETTALSLQTFVLACLVYPDWVGKAQKQIDDVVGPDSLPTFADRPHLPYVEAIVRETLRWRPAARFGVPHQSTADDVVDCNGERYFIPKGSTVFAVAWAIDHDQKKYAHPDRFDPERYLDEKGQLRPNYETSAFGFGRRMCPGIPFAERSLWIDIAMLLWTFDILKSREPNPETGLVFQYDDSDAAFHGDFSNAPREFPAMFRPRSARHAEVARREWELSEKDLSVILPAPKD